MKITSVKLNIALIFVIGFAYLLSRDSCFLCEDDDEYSRWVWENMCRDQMQKHADEARISFLKFGLQSTLQRNGPFLTDCYQNLAKLTFDGEKFIVIGYGKDRIEGTEDDMQVVSKAVRSPPRLPFENSENLELNAD